MTIADVFAELKREPRWICWRRATDKSGNTTKPPVSPITGGGAKTNDPNTWATYDAAKAYAKANPGIAGLGFVLGGGVAGIDIDHCRNPQTGEISALAQEIVSAVDSYTEISPSGDGLHILLRTGANPKPPAWGANHDVPDFDGHPQHIEVYTGGRYFTVTGKPFDTLRPVAERPQAIPDLCARYPKAAQSAPAPANTQAQQTARSAASSVRTDDEVLDCMFRAEPYGQDIRDLFHGDLTRYGGDRSRGHMSLCNSLAYWTDCDAAQMDRLFRRSALYQRDSFYQTDWDRPHRADGTTYGQMTIERAIEWTQANTGTYNGRLLSRAEAGAQIAENTDADSLSSVISQKRGNAAAQILAGTNAAAYGAERWADDIASFSEYSDRKTGFVNMDKQGAFYPGLYVVGAATSLGKTTFVLQLADYLAGAGEPVLFFSLEQSAFELYSKSIARSAYVAAGVQAPSSIRIRNGKLRDMRDVVEAAEEEYRNGAARNLTVYDQGFGIRSCDVDATVRAYMRETGNTPVVIVDYLQALAPDDPRATERASVDTAVQRLKMLNRDLGCTVIVISSINRSSYLSPISFEAFKESGGIEFTADVVWGLELGCMTDPYFESEKNVVVKGKAVRAAKAESPREIQLSCLKNRFGRSCYDAKFRYYPAHDYFQALTEFDLLPDGGFIPDPMSEWRMIIAKAKREAAEKRAETAEIRAERRAERELAEMADSAADFEDATPEQIAFLNSQFGEMPSVSSGAEELPY